MPEDVRNELMNRYVKFVDTGLTGKERSELTENRILNYLGINKPNTTEYDFDFINERFELKQAEDYLKQPKFQQIKPRLYPYIVCLLNGKERSRWYIMRTENISKLAGKENQEVGRLPMHRQHKDNDQEGQFPPNKKFFELAEEIGEFSPLVYHEENLNISDNELNQIFTRIEELVG